VIPTTGASAVVVVSVGACGEAPGGTNGAGDILAKRSEERLEFTQK